MSCVNGSLTGLRAAIGRRWVFNASKLTRASVAVSNQWCVRNEPYRTTAIIEGQIGTTVATVCTAVRKIATPVNRFIDFEFSLVAMIDSLIVLWSASILSWSLMPKLPPVVLIFAFVRRVTEVY